MSNRPVHLSEHLLRTGAVVMALALVATGALAALAEKAVAAPAGTVTNFSLGMNDPSDMTAGPDGTRASSHPRA